MQSATQAVNPMLLTASLDGSAGQPSEAMGITVRTGRREIAQGPASL